MMSNDSSQQAVHTQCPRCGQEADLVPKQYRTWFTLFFIPVFPISGVRRFVECSNCGAGFQVSSQQIAARVSENEQQQSQQAIGLYNSLRASPANSITLDQLMKLYASMKEYDQAVSAAADFPQALHNSEQAMTTLGRVYLAQNKFDEAIKWFDAAIARNDQLAEAHYYKAVTYLMTQPPDPAKAVASARVARNLGFPNADALLREAETKARGGN
jgi:tetratricopeptide (TPR) repeat protein